MKENSIAMIDAHQLASLIRNGGSRLDKMLIVDSRSFLEYNDLHVVGAVNVCCSKLVKRRLQQDKVCVRDFLLHSCPHLLERGLLDIDGSTAASTDVVVYDQSSALVGSISMDSFLYVLLEKLGTLFRRVYLLSGGFLEFQASYGDLCEDKTRLLGAGGGAALGVMGLGLSFMTSGRSMAATATSLMTASCLTSISQPCLPITNVGPTRILPFLYLGSQQDAHNQQLLSDYNITYEVNVSTNCPKPDFILDSHFLRLPVNDSYGEKLLPYFVRATQFIDRVRETNGSVLVHCLAGISRSPTVAIAYVMRHLRLTFDDAFRYVKSKRPTISPNFNFLGQLLEYERQLRSEEVLHDDLGSSSSSSRFLNSSELSNNNAGMDMVDHIAPPKAPLTGDLSPTAALARLTFEAPPPPEERSSSSSYVLVSRRNKSCGGMQREESSYRSLMRQRMSSGSEAATTSSSSHFYSKETSQRLSSGGSSSLVLTVSQSSSSKRITSGIPPTGRSNNKDDPAAAAKDFCAEISVEIQPEVEEEEVEIRHKLRGVGQIRPHSDGAFRNLLGGSRTVPLSAPGRRPSNASYCSSAGTTDELLFPPTPSSPPAGHPCLLSPQTPWGLGYARSDSVTTSGLGSEISDSDYTGRGDDALSMCSGMSGGSGLRPSDTAGFDLMDSASSIAPDDGVFTEAPPVRPPLRSTRPRPSSLLGIVPARDVDWRPSCITGEKMVVDEPVFPSLRPTKERTSPPAFEADLGGNVASGEDLPDSATVFRLWRQREAAMTEQDSSVNSSLRRKSKEILLPIPPSSVNKRKSSELPEDALTTAGPSNSQAADGDESEAATSTPSSGGTKRRTTRGDVQVDEQLYRVKSCPDIEDALLLEEVKMRARNPVNQQQQRYSCGASLDNQALTELSPSKSCRGSNSVIQVS